MMEELRYVWSTGFDWLIIVTVFAELAPLFCLLVLPRLAGCRRGWGLSPTFIEVGAGMLAMLIVYCYCLLCSDSDLVGTEAMKQAFVFAPTSATMFAFGAVHFGCRYRDVRAARRAWSRRPAYRPHAAHPWMLIGRRHRSVRGHEDESERTLCRAGHSLGRHGARGGGIVLRGAGTEAAIATA